MEPWNDIPFCLVQRIAIEARKKKKYRALHDGAEGRLQRNGVTTNIFSAIRDKIKHKNIDNCTSYTYLLARQLVGHLPILALSRVYFLSTLV